MGLLESFHKWRETRYENYIQRMKEENKCPDCYGKGFHLYPAPELIFHEEQLDCISCGGTGTYQEWEKEQ